MKENQVQDMTVSVEAADEMLVKMTIQIPDTSIAPEIHKEILEIKKRYHPPGFRKNHVPYQVIHRKFARDIHREVTEKMTGNAIEQALEQEGLAYIREPKIEVVQSELGQQFEFKAEFEKMPDFQAPDVADIELVEPDVSVGKQDIDEAIEQLKKRYPDWVDSEQPSKTHDRVVIDFEGTIDGEVFDGGVGKDQADVLGSSAFLPDFESNLLGRNVGDEFTFPVTFPDDYFKPSLAGKLADFTVNIKSVQSPKPVVVGKAFYARCGYPVTKKADFTKAVSDTLSNELAGKIAEYRKKKLFDWIDTSYHFDVPKSLVSEEFKRKASGMDDADRTAVESELTTSDNVHAVQSRRSVKISIVLKSIADKYDLKIEESDVEQYFTALGLPADQVSQYAQWFLSDSQRATTLMGGILEQKTFRYVTDHAKPTKEAFAYSDFVTLNLED
ncbi:MAG: trigger factor [Legionellales bacterium]|nr:trigger factor [Legionellales bacterium]|tara:strand:- start:1712 stop:3040 length:1329 start_codon:yes stop_codon:yes gene_type:complete